MAAGGALEELDTSADEGEAGEEEEEEEEEDDEDETEEGEEITGAEGTVRGLEWTGTTEGWTWGLGLGLVVRLVGGLGGWQT